MAASRYEDIIALIVYAVVCFPIMHPSPLALYVHEDHSETRLATSVTVASFLIASHLHVIVSNPYVPFSLYVYVAAAVAAPPGALHSASVKRVEMTKKNGKKAIATNS